MSTTVSNPEKANTTTPFKGLPLEIWLEIFKFATRTSRGTNIAPVDPFIPDILSNNALGTNSPVLSMKTKCALVLVCRAWRKVAIELLYEHISIRSTRISLNVLEALSGKRTCEQSDIAHWNREDPQVGFYKSEYGQWARHIEVFTYCPGGSSLHYLNSVFLVFQHCPNLRMLSGQWMWPLPMKFMDSIVNLYGPSLQGLSWDGVNNHIEIKTVVTPRYLASFQSLRVLDLRNFACDVTSHCPHLVNPILPCVQDLLISTKHRSLLAATHLDLPALRRLTIDESSSAIPYHLVVDFLKVHGPSLTSLELVFPPNSACTELSIPPQHLDTNIFLQPNVCPNLLSVVISHSSPLMFPIFQPHPSLQRIGIRGVDAGSLDISKQTHLAAHLLTMNAIIFPNLQAIRTIGFLLEAQTHMLADAYFIWWTEWFAKDGVEFQDGAGVVWRYDDDDDENMQTCSLVEDGIEKPMYLRPRFCHERDDDDDEWED